MNKAINEQMKLELAKKTLDFLQVEISKEGYVGIDACLAQDEVLMLAMHASIGIDALKRQLS